MKIQQINPLALRMLCSETKLQIVGAGNPPSTVVIDGVPVLVEGVRSLSGSFVAVPCSECMFALLAERLPPKCTTSR